MAISLASWAVQAVANLKVVKKHRHDYSYAITTSPSNDLKLTRVVAEWAECSLEVVMHISCFLGVSAALSVTASIRPALGS